MFHGSIQLKKTLLAICPVCFRGDVQYVSFETVAKVMFSISVAKHQLQARAFFVYTGQPGTQSTSTVLRCVLPGLFRRCDCCCNRYECRLLSIVA